MSRPKGTPASPELRSRQSMVMKANWARMTPEERSARGRLAHQHRLEQEADPYMEPVRLSPAYRQALQVACTRWMQSGVPDDALEALVVALVVEADDLERVLMLLHRDVVEGDADHQTAGHLAALADRLCQVHDHLGEAADVANMLAMLIGIDPRVGIVHPLPEAPGSTRWVQ